MTPARPYHHGNLRQAVLEQAMPVVRERGAAELSLRELAATIGVTHAAVRRYFPDRQQLHDALAVEGFALLGARLRGAVEGAPDYRAQIHSIARAYLDFVTSEANLAELMFAHKHGEGGDAVSESAEAAFSPILLVFQRGLAGDPRSTSPERTALIFFATLQGLAGLVNCGMISADRLGGFIDEAVAQFPQGDVDDSAERAGI
ncbi:TetR/AcrR family transcriptional regulator [Nocardia carnea]|uniref:TetR/AcrR family transcriptional regulator n=1 Tax=Nocardia carnea TaxID=37328 RepID=UPI0024562255|nr:TetR/AcrR family transcriptional regulator [Nocardia carnea]